jgi:phage/plasmid-like protein (TIGR03299 family)
MGHELSFKEGRAQMFFYGKRPWHELGVELDHPATAKEAITAAQLGYRVESYPVAAEISGAYNTIPGKVATVRTDTNKILGVVGTGYKVVQNVEAFDFFDNLVGEGQAIYHTAGALGQGERIWLLAKLPKNIVLGKDDVVEKYLILTNSHDGTSALKVYWSTVRVVCNNTLTASLRDAKQGVNIRHSGNIKSKTDEARRVLGISIKYYQEFEELCKQLLNYKVKKSEIEGFYDRVVFGDDLKNRDSAILKNRKEFMLHLFENGRGNDMPDVRHSLWAGVNGTSEFFDHYKPIKNERERPTNRLNSIWFGHAARQKARAFDIACEMIGAK